MATILLTAVGTAIAGPIGGIFGAIAGQSADQFLFAPRRQVGPRLGDLTVQGSSYGQPIARLYGRMRVAGQVIWATDLTEDRHKSGGGKGRPKTVSYTYSASLAVALSARPIRAVRRVWADGRLIYEQGRWGVPVTARVHMGDEGQQADPLIAAAEGPGMTPAYRGLAYVVLEDLELSEFGNRIPMLTFEVEADAAPTGFGLVADDLTGDLLGSASFDTPFRGLAVSGAGTVRAVLESFDQAAPISLADDGDDLTLRAVQPAGAVTDIPRLALGSRGEGSSAASATQMSTPAADRLPGVLTMTYFDVARDYQLGLQRARREGAGVREERVELAAALDAGAAKMLAERRLADRWARGTTAHVSLPVDHLAIRPGDQHRLPGRSERWLVRGWSFENGVVAMEVERVGPPAPPQAVSDPGRAIGQGVALQGETILHAFELPAMLDAPPSQPRLWIAGAGTETGWRGAALSRSLDGGASWQEQGRLNPGLAAGVVTSPPASGSCALRDDRNSIEVLLANDAMSLEGATDDLLQSGANLALVGDELIQFGRVVEIGPRQYRLSRLLRGRWGSEAVVASHVEGERFIQLDADLMVPLDLPVERIGGAVGVRASLFGAPVDEAVSLNHLIQGTTLRPLSPVFLSARRESDGAILIRWVRRSRQGWAWLDGIDAPLGEAAERYRLRVQSVGGTTRQIEIDETEWRYDADLQAIDSGGPVTDFIVELSQLSALAGAGQVAIRNFTIP